jgi:peptide deformylase
MKNSKTSVRNVLVTDERLLRRPCQPCHSVTEGLRIGRELLAFVHEYNRKNLTVSAAGLAAPQLGILKRVCVITLNPKVPLVLVNPTIVAHSDTQVPWQESCISLPGKKVWTRRYTWVEVHADNFGFQKTERFGLSEPKGVEPMDRRKLLEAVVAQHEISHLNGEIITDFEETQ